MGGVSEVYEPVVDGERDAGADDGGADGLEGVVGCEEGGVGAVGGQVLGGEVAEDVDCHRGDNLGEVWTALLDTTVGPDGDEEGGENA